VVPYKVFKDASLSISDLMTVATAEHVRALDGGTLYFTFTGFGLALAAAVLGRRQPLLLRVSRPSFAVALFGLAFALPMIPPLGWIFYNLPVVNLVRSPARGLFLFGFAGALLAGVGLDSLRTLTARAFRYGRCEWYGVDASRVLATAVVLILAMELHGFLPARIERPVDASNSGLTAIRSGPVTLKLRELAGEGPLAFRYFGSEQDVPPNIGNVHPVLSVHGYRSSRAKAFHDYFDFNPHSPKADSLGIRWWVSSAPIDGLPLKAEIGGKRIYERPSAPPIFWQPQPGEGKVDPGIDGVEWQSNSVRVTFKQPITGPLVFAQTAYPGFKAIADGRTLDVGLHEGLMALDLSAPTRVVTFVYAPDWLPWSVTLAICTILATLFLSILMVKSNRREGGSLKEASPEVERGNL
jgi:hypothetical protein